MIHLLDSEFVLPNRHTKDKLHSTPESMELCTLVYVHDTISRGKTMIHRVLNEGPDTCQDDLKHRQATTQALTCQQVTLLGYIPLLETRNLIILINLSDSVHGHDEFQSIIAEKGQVPGKNHKSSVSKWRSFSPLNI